MVRRMISAKHGRQVSTYCYQCVNGPDRLIVDVVDGRDAEVKAFPSNEATARCGPDGL